MNTENMKGNNVSDEKTTKPPERPIRDIWFRIDSKTFEELGKIVVGSGRKSMSNVVAYACAELIRDEKKKHPEWFPDECIKETPDDKV